MLRYDNQNNGKSIGKDGAQAVSAVYCKLFSDTVTKSICQLRKQELNNRGGFSCVGCLMERY